MHRLAIKSKEIYNKKNKVKKMFKNKVQKWRSICLHKNKFLLFLVNQKILDHDRSLVKNDRIFKAYKVLIIKSVPRFFMKPAKNMGKKNNVDKKSFSY